MSNLTSPQRLSIGLCILNQDGELFIVQRPQDDLLWQMPEFPVEAETDLSLAVNSAMGLLLPNIEFSLLNIHDKWLTQEIPDYIAKKEGLTGATVEQEKWFILRLNASISPDQVNEDLYTKAQWVTAEHLLTLITPYKRLTYTTIIHAFQDYMTANQKADLATDFKSDAQTFSKKTRQNSHS